MKALQKKEETVHTILQGAGAGKYLVILHTRRNQPILFTLFTIQK